MYLHEINEKSRTGINRYFYIKNPLLWEWHFHKLLCEEIIFPLHKGKNDGLRYEVNSGHFVTLLNIYGYINYLTIFFLIMKKAATLLFKYF